MGRTNKSDLTVREAIYELSETRKLLQAFLRGNRAKYGYLRRVQERLMTSNKALNKLNRGLKLRVKSLETKCFQLQVDKESLLKYIKELEIFIHVDKEI